MKNNRGFVQMILIILGALVLLRYVYSIDVVGFLTTGKPKEVLDQIYSLGSKGWAKYSESIIRVWEYIFNLAKNLIAKIK